MNQGTDARYNEQHQAAEIIQNEADWRVKNPADVDPIPLGRGNICPLKNQTAADETPKNGRDGNKTAEIFPAPGEERNERS